MKKTIAILLIFAFSLILPARAIESQKYMSRGEAVSMIMRAFDLANREKGFLRECETHAEDCFFVFGAMSHFDDMSFSPLILYPDVSVAYLYYEDISMATMLGLVHGYLEEKNSPFYPRAAITRIQALKVILGAAKLMPWKEKFEFIAQLGEEKNLKKQKSVFADVKSENEHMWWYFRYIDFCLENGIIDNEKYFRPDEPFSREDFEIILNKVLKLLQK